jgi:hypothetical protein
MGRNDQGFLGGLSPEEILAKKEMEGGVHYDDPFIPEGPKVEEDSPEQKRFPDEVMLDAKPPIPVWTDNPENVYSDSIKSVEDPASLGKAETFIPPIQPKVEPTFSPGMEIGWKNLPLTILPSGGLFYPEGTKVAIRPAETKEIRHFSSIDEDDLLDLNEKLNFVIEKCSVVNFPNSGVVSYKDLKQEDRFFLIMAIRDLTFLQGENRIILTPETGCKDKKSCPINSGIELRTGVLSSYKIDPRVMKYYSPVTRNFVFPVKKIGKEISMFVPSIGVMDAVSSFVVDCGRRGIEVGDDFIKIAPFLFQDWRGLTPEKIMTKMEESDVWSKEEFSLYYQLCESIKIGTELDVNLSCPTCGAEVTAPITFPGGFKSLFVITDIFRELL